MYHLYVESFKKNVIKLKETDSKQTNKNPDRAGEKGEANKRVHTQSYKTNKA